MKKKLTLRLDSLTVETFVPSDALGERGTVRAAESGDSACATAFLSDCGTYCATNCWPYCATGDWNCETLNTCAATGDCCKPSSNNVDCEI